MGRKSISGGGDSALDWAIYFAEHNNSLWDWYRSESFRAHKDSVEKVHQLQKAGKIEFYTHAEVVDLNGDENCLP